MKSVLYLMRHATADVRSGLVEDIDRCLNEKGRLQARRVAAFMHKHQLIPDKILCSPFARAVQTAALLRKDLELAEAVAEQDWLAPGTSATQMAEQLKAQLADGQALLVVGHEPELAMLIQQLLGLSAAFVELKKASLSCLEFETEPGLPVRLAWSIPARLMG
ncbi:phosphohistidine phosphatase SixA [Rheinheimera marina]|uniref:Phosphohistidine phosphatase SixA n=1 Tax=Rheinheimera marina TaxID=1774958 RepID=A0ABV9JMM2_9GAMM